MMRILAVIAMIALAASAAEFVTSADLSRTIADRYVVVFRDDADVASHFDELLSVSASDISLTAEVTATYGHALKGYAAKLCPSMLAYVLSHPTVAYVEPDYVVRSTSPHFNFDGLERVGDDVSSPSDTCKAQSDSTWGLGRISHRSWDGSKTYQYNTTASNVVIYVVDTGIAVNNVDFGSRATWGASFVGESSDGNGHGTHVASTSGGTVYGVAKGAELVAVQVLGANGSGSNSGVISGIDWVASQYNARKSTIDGAVANLSLGGPASVATDAAVEAAVLAGVTFVVAAGNENSNACNSSPARAPHAITVGSTTSSNTRSSFSNYGTCVDILAPGSDIKAAWIGSNTATATISGTSMASPHVAGAAAIYLANNPHASSAEVKEALKSDGTKDQITLNCGIFNSGCTSTPNDLLYTACDE